MLELVILVEEITDLPILLVYHLAVSVRGSLIDGLDLLGELVVAVEEVRDLTVFVVHCFVCFLDLCLTGSRDFLELHLKWLQ